MVNGFANLPNVAKRQVIEALEERSGPFPVQDGSVVAELFAFYDHVIGLAVRMEAEEKLDAKIVEQFRHGRLTLEYIVNHPSGYNPQWPEQYAEMVLKRLHDLFEKKIRHDHEATPETIPNPETMEI